MVQQGYKQKAENAKTEFKYSVDIPSDIYVNASDAYIIMGNTIDNAIEACKSVEEEKRYIDIKLTKRYNMLLYQISNPYSPGYRNIKKGRGHGYGLRNVEQCAKKYRGSVTINDENGEFTLMVVINNN